MRILIVDDHLLLAEALATALEEQLGAEVHIAGTAARAMTMALELSPSVALVDVRLPDESGISLGRRMRGSLRECRIIAITAQPGRDRLDEAMAAGFRGFVSKQVPVARIADAVLSVQRGEIVIEAERARADDGARASEDWQAALLASQLTPRERELLRLLAEGRGTQQIAARLTISPNTVRTHVQSVLSKLQVHSRMEAAAFAIRHSLLDDRAPV